MRYVDGLTDKSGKREIWRLLSPDQWDADPTVVFGCRKFVDHEIQRRGHWFDLKYLWDHSGDLLSLAERFSYPGYGQLCEAEERFKAHVTAAEATQADTKSVPIRDLVPEDVFVRFKAERIKAIQAAWLSSSSKLFDQWFETKQILDDVLDMERSGIFVDVPLAEKFLKQSRPPHERRFLESAVDLQTNGMAWTRVNAYPSVTGRLNVEGGLDIMSTPHGDCRKIIRSRFEGGKIGTVDFNAADYRSIVAAMAQNGDKRLAEFYKGAEDFHLRTASLFDPSPTEELRQRVKKATYASIYNSSDSSLKQGTARDEIGQRLEKLFEPVAEFRNKMAELGKMKGQLLLPNGRYMPVGADEHPGKILSHYAQRYASWMFLQALNRILANNLKSSNPAQSKVIFTVHDEIVVDMHPTELDQIKGYAWHMRQATRVNGSEGFAVKTGMGDTYAEAAH